VTPRVRSVAPFARSLGDEAVAFAAAAGLKLDDWQADVARGVFGLNDAGRFAHFEGAVNVARQNGKGAILEALELYAMFEWPGRNLVIHSAHEFRTATEHQMRLESLIQDTPELHSRVRGTGGYRHANGSESINLKSGSRIVFKARTKGGARGYSADLLVWDEAMDLPDAVVGAMLPTLRASSAAYGPLIVYAGSAVDQELMENGVTWARVRERGLAGEPGLAYFEWSADVGDPKDDHPSLLDDVLMERLEHRQQANPALGGRIPLAHMDRELRSMAPRTAAVELFGVGDWPRTDGLEDSVINVADWDRLERRDSKLQRPFCLAFDVSPERRTSVAAAGLNEEGRWHVEIHEHKPGTSWLPERLAEMVERGDPDVVVCDGVGPAASLLVPLAEQGVRVEVVSSSEHGQACGRLVDMVTEGSLAHLGSVELRDAIRGAKSRPLGDAWLWSRKSSSVDISPLVAATLALGAAAGIAGSTEVMIY
jgi:hypothetical protein